MQDSIPQDDTPLKQCLACHEWKPATPAYFIRAHRTLDGFRNPCKVCKKEGRKCHVEEKRCHKCQRLLPKTREAFHDARKKNGVLEANCIQCRAAIHREEHPRKPREKLPDGS